MSGQEFLDSLERMAQRRGISGKELGRAMADALDQGDAKYPDNERKAMLYGVELIRQKYPVKDGDSE